MIWGKVLKQRKKNGDTPYFETEKFCQKWAWADAKTFKRFFLKTIIMPKLWDTRGPNSASFLSTNLKFGSFIVKHRRFQFTKVLFRGLGCKIQRKRPFKKKNVKTVLDCECQIWKCNNWCHQTQHVQLGTPEREHKGGKQGVRSLYLFEITK